MALFLAGQVLTADDLNAIVWTVVEQGTHQSVTSSTTLVDSAIVVPVGGLTIINLMGVYQSGGGGIRWAWRATGTVAGRHSAWAPGADATGGVVTATSYQHRQQSMTADFSINHFNTTSTNAFGGRLRCTGVGDAILQFAQETSDAADTELRQDTWVEWVRAEAA